jgi:peptidyl-prolyl cis-trans isomerase SurA
MFKKPTLFLSLFAASLLSFATAAPAAPVLADRIVAVVNDEVITAAELESRLAGVERQLRNQGTQLPPREVLQKQMLERMIMDRVQLQYARETGVQVADAELDAALRRIADGNRMSMAEFKAALEKDGLVWSVFRDEIRGEMIIGRVRDREVDNRVTVSDGEIDNYLANPDTGGSNAEVALAHIVLRVPDQASPEQLIRIRARAEQALDQIRRGDDFAKVAATFSDASDALSGGAMPFRPLDRLPNVYATLAQKMQPGDVSDIVRTPAGYHILKMVDRRGGAAVVQMLKRTHARHILIRANELVSEDEARRKLVGLKERLEHGGDFAELARLYSNDLSAAKGGDLGWLYQGDTVPDFEKAMDALKINEISDPVQTPFGFHLIQVLERRTEASTAERQRLSARAALRERKADEAYQDWLRQMRDRAYVEYRLEDR